MLDREGACEVFPAPFGVCIKDDIHNYVEPDISLICNDDILRRNSCYGPPDLVIEIVSPSNRKMDYVRKLALYRTSGVREYWIVDPRHETVTVYDLEHGKEPVLYPFSERIKVGGYDDLYLDVTAKSAELGKNLQEERMARQAKAHAEGHAEGRAEGLKEGEARLARLTTLLLQEGRTNDLTRALSDLECRDTLYREYHLSFLFSHDTPHILLRFHSRNHDLMPAARAFEAKIRTNSQHLPFGRAAGVLLFHF